jgi:[ribosomal protein S18]-alanine N-acetyltransferase
MSNFDHVVYNSRMDFANHWRSQETAVPQPDWHLRTAEADDAAAISRLVRLARRAHMHVDWRLPVDWLGSPHFVVAATDDDRPANLRSRLFGRAADLFGCLAATPDPPPVAWVRVAALANDQDEEPLLGEMVAAVAASLRETAVTQLAWLVMGGWPGVILPELGFTQSNEIETYVKESLDSPAPLLAHPDLHIRPVKPADMAGLAALEEEAFDPLWRFSSETLFLAQREALCFDVAQWNGRLVGYQFSSRSPEGAHLVRLTIAPAWQGQGVGSALLSAAIQTYRRFGLHHVSLNTQVDNLTSQRLYKKFGFRATGERLPVWVKAL